jgi:GTP-binding protein
VRGVRAGRHGIWLVICLDSMTYWNSMRTIGSGNSYVDKSRFEIIVKLDIIAGKPRIKSTDDQIFEMSSVRPFRLICRNYFLNSVLQMFKAARFQQCAAVPGPGLQLLLRRGGFRTVSTTTIASKASGVTPKNRDYLNFPSSNLSHHWDTLPPTSAQLRYAETFFSKAPPKFLWSAPKLQTMSFGDSPEVCFLGRSNVGKSSLLNTILGRKLAHTSSKPGRTRLMNAFAVGEDDGNGRNRLVVLDMPGYGKGGRAEWGQEILKYLEKRNELKRAFLLVDTMHGLKSSDEQLLALFRQRNIPHQIVLAKVDCLLFPTSRTPSEQALEARFAELRRTMETIKRAIQPNVEDMSGALGELVACSSEKKINGKKLGIDSVRHAMLQAAGLEYQPPLKRIEIPEIIPYEDIPWNSQTPIS